MSGAGTEAELRRLAHTLGLAPERLEMLREVSAPDLRVLRAQAAEALFQADRQHFVRVAALSKAVPTALSARLTELALPPLLAARTAELIEPRRAAELVGRLSDSYLADVSAIMDAARAPEVVAAIPPERVARIGAELARRGEWVVIAGFVAEVNGTALSAAVAVLTGDQWLRTGFVLDDDERLNQVAQLLTDAQLDEMVAAAAEHERWAELSDLLHRLDDARRERVVRHLGRATAPVREAYARAADIGALESGALDVSGPEVSGRELRALDRDLPGREAAVRIDAPPPA